MKRVFCNSVMIAGIALASAAFTLPAHAACMCEVMVQTTEQKEWNDKKNGTVAVIENFVKAEFTAHRSWYISVFWEDNLLPALQMFADQLTSSSMHQSQAMGMFMDAKNQIQTQQEYGKTRAQSYADYQPSVGMCQFGSSVKSLTTSERQSEFNARVMSQRSLDRQLGASGSSGAYGSLDKASRTKQLKNFCSKDSNNGGMDAICSGENQDIDYTSTIDAPWTIDVNFSGDAGGAPGKDEAAVFALGNYLYANDVFARPGAASLAPDPKGDMTDMQKNYLDMRGVVAQRSIAENSFNAIMAMKSAGSGEGSHDFLKALLLELKVPEKDITDLMGANPSYYAQMEVLTKKIYQSPDFYTNLYDSPANVKRKDVSLQAIGLMQKFDMLKSYLRSEASLSMLLELAVENEQSGAENETNRRGSNREGDTD